MGNAAIGEMLVSKKPLFEFVIRHRISQFSLGDLDSRVAAARAAAPVVAEITDSALKTGYIKALADWVSLDSSEVEQMVRAGVTKLVQRRVEPMRQAGAQAPEVVSPQARMERQILEVLVQAPGAFSADQLRRMLASGFSHSQHQRILEIANFNSDHLSEDGFANLLATQVDPEDVEVIRALALADLPVANEQDLSKYTGGVVRTAMLNTLGREKVDLMAALRRIDATASPEQVAQVQKELMALETERRELMK
jgi:DNA primase